MGIKVRMYMFIGLSCLVVFIHSSASVPLVDQKPTPVNIAYFCIRSKNHKTSDETPIILIHGLGSSKESWKGIYQVLAMMTHRKVCLADLRNHGDSPWSDISDVAAMTEDISRLLDNLKTPKAILLGHSLGGKVSMHFALNYPEKVQKLIIEDMRPNGLTPEATQAVMHYLRLLQASIDVIPLDADERTAKKVVAQFFNHELAKVNSSGLINKRSADLLPITCSEGVCRWKTNTNMIGRILKNATVFMNESSGRFDGPSLFVYGTKSPFKIKEDKSSILKLFPKAKLVGIDGASHLVHAHREFLDVVIKFINVKN